MQVVDRIFFTSSLVLAANEDSAGYDDSGVWFWPQLLTARAAKVQHLSLRPAVLGCRVMVILPFLAMIHSRVHE